MRHASNETGKRHMTEGMELLNQEKIRTLGKKETFKYLGILEANTIKQVEMKEKIKSIAGEPENYTRRNYLAGKSSKGLINGLSST